MSKRPVKPRKPSILEINPVRPENDTFVELFVVQTDDENMKYDLSPLDSFASEDSCVQTDFKLSNLLLLLNRYSINPESVEIKCDLDYDAIIIRCQLSNSVFYEAEVEKYHKLIKEISEAKRKYECELEKYKKDIAAYEIEKAKAILARNST